MTSVQSNNKYADAALITRYESAGKRCGQLAIVLGTAVLLGWASGIVTLTNLLPEWVAMRPNTALCLILTGTSLLAAGKSRSDRPWCIVQIASAMIVFGVGLATLIEHGLGLQFGIDLFYHAGSAMPEHRLFPSRMAVATATNFLLMGAALAILDTRARRLPQLLALFAMGVATLAILGYAYGVSALHDVGFFSIVALHAAIGTWLVGLGILLVRPAHGLVAVLVSGTVGGVLARRLLPLAVQPLFCSAGCGSREKGDNSMTPASALP